MDRPLDRVGFHDRRANLISKQVDRMGGVVPQQVIGPTARLSQSVHVGAAKEKGLHIHVLDVEFIRHDLAADPLVAGVEAACMAAHCHQTGLLLQRNHFLGVAQHIGDGDFNLHMLAGFQASDRLSRMERCRRCQDHRVDITPRQYFIKVRCAERDAILGCYRPGFVGPGTDQSHHFDIGNILDTVQVFRAERAGPGDGDLDRLAQFILPVLPASKGASDCQPTVSAAVPGWSRYAE